MLSDVRIHARNNLRGNRLKSIVVSVAPCICRILLILSTASSFYLLVVDTYFLSSLGLLENISVHFTVTALLIVENIALYFLYNFSRFYAKNYFVYYSVEKIKFSDVIGCSLLYFCIFMFNMMMLLLFLAPCVVSTIVILKIAERGVAASVFCIMMLSDVIILSAGLICYRIYTLKAYLADVYFYKTKSIASAFRCSFRKMNGKCIKLLMFEIKYFYMRFLSALLLPLFHYLPLYKAMRSFFVLEKEIPYVDKRRHTEKTIVFYF